MSLIKTNQLAFSTSIDVAADVRERFIDRLNLRLADAIHVKLMAKHAHWNVKGKGAFALHQLFDVIAEHGEEQSDLIAERTAALGGLAEGALRQVVENSGLPDYDLDAHLGEQHLRALAIPLALFGSQLRADSDFAEDLGDRASADLLTQIVQQVDKDLWMVEAHLQS